MSRITQVVSNTNTVVKKIVVGTPIKRVSGNITNFGNINSANPLHGQTLLYDSDLGKFVPSNTGIDSAAIIKLIDSDYITSRVTAGGGSTLIQGFAEDGQVLIYDSDIKKYKPVFFSDEFANSLAILDSSEIISLIDSAYITSRVNPNLLPDVVVDSNTIVRIVDSAYITARVGDVGTSIDSAELIKLENRIDSAELRLDTRIDNLFIEAIDSNLVSKVIPNVVDSNYVTSRIQYYDDFARERIYDSDSDTIGTLFTRLNRTMIPIIGQEISLGTIDRPFQDLFLSPNSLVIGRTKISEAVDGTLTFTKVGDDGTELEGAAANAVSFSFRDSDVGKVQSFVYDQDSNKLTLEIANQDTIVLNIDRMNDLELLGELKGPQDFVIAPFPHDGPTGQLTVRGRLFVEGDEFATDAATVRFNQAKALELGTTFDSAIDANGGGFILGGANVYLRYNYNTDRWQTNRGIIATDFQGRYRGFDSDLINTNTDGLPEGSRNLYYTQTRVDNRVQQVVDETYIRSRQLTTQLDSNQIANIVVQYVDEDYQGSVQNLLNQLDSSQSIVRGIVDSDYITSKFKAVNGKVTSISVDPSQTEYVFQPADSDILYVQDSDISGKILNFDRHNVSVYLNGSRLVAPYDFTTDSHGRRVTFAENIGPGNTIVVTSARTDKINFSNALVDSDQTIASDSAGRFDIFPKSSFRYAKYLITASVTVNSVAKYQASEVLVAHNDIDASYSEYGIVQTQDSSLGDVVAEIDGANVKVSFDPEYANTTVKFSRLTL